MTYVNFKLDTDANGIALITWDAPGRSMNVIDLIVIEELSDIVAGNVHPYVRRDGKGTRRGGRGHRAFRG